MINHSLAYWPLNDCADNYQCTESLPSLQPESLTGKGGCFQLIHTGREKKEEQEEERKGCIKMYKGLYKNVGTMKQTVVSDNSGH